jgi:hypothetical protein
LVKRIIVNISLIILGEKGYRKAILITKLNKIFNNGESIFEIIYKQTGITDDKLCIILEKIYKKAKNLKYKEKI